MELRIFRHLWGITEPWKTLFPKIRDLGYYGIEHILPDHSERDLFQTQLEHNNFQYVAQMITVGDSVADHIASFRNTVTDALTMNPRLINCHSGCDWFSDEDALRYFGEALEFEARTGIQVAHETHRGRILYNPWTTERLLRKLPGLRLSCDFSHWVVVSERLLDRETDIIAACAERCIHIHARVGYEEGPQVTDPRAPEYERHVLAHERWWKMVWAAQERRGMSESTLTPEFGAPDYQHTMPHSKAPIGNLWDICNWQAERQRTQFAQRHAVS
jgi:sugar phosphate isomerase/epimerase